MASLKTCPVCDQREESGNHRLCQQAIFEQMWIAPIKQAFLLGLGADLPKKLRQQFLDHPCDAWMRVKAKSFKADVGTKEQADAAYQVLLKRTRQSAKDEGIDSTI